MAFHSYFCWHLRARSRQQHTGDQRRTIRLKQVLKLMFVKWRPVALRWGSHEELYGPLLFYHFPISHARSHVTAPKLVPSPPPPKKSNEHRFSGYHFTLCIVNVSNCLTWVSGSVGAVFISLTFYVHDNVANNESVFVGISESRPHCTDRISRDPHTRCAVTSSVTWRR